MLFRSSTLHMRHNELSYLPTSFSNLTNLDFVNMQSNKFRVIPPVIKKWTRLHSLCIKDNEISSLDMDIICALLPTTWLNVKSNLLTSLPWRFVGWIQGGKPCETYIAPTAVSCVRIELNLNPMTAKKGVRSVGGTPPSLKSICSRAICLYLDVSKIGRAHV